MKVIIITQGRSGGTLLYRTLARYVAPHQLDEGLWKSDYFDEPFGKMDDKYVTDEYLQLEQQRYEYITSNESWVVKLHADNVKNYNCSMHSNLYRQSDCVVKLIRKDIRQRIISLCVAEMTQEWIHYTEQQVVVPKQLLIQEYYNAHTERDQLLSTICDVVVYYEDIIQSYPREIANNILDMSFEDLTPTQFELKKRSSTTVVNLKQVHEWMDELDKVWYDQ